jgi:essential nuclear protein 1
MVLLEKCRDDIRNNSKLNYHYYMALKKALFKPAAFYKGLLLPLAQSRTCTLREATIIGSVLSKVSVPGIHSAAALLRLAEMPYSGSTSLFIRVLLQKEYALPRRVIDSLIHHFCGFEKEASTLPVRTLAAVNLKQLVHLTFLALILVHLRLSGTSPYLLSYRDISSSCRMCNKRNFAN